MCCDFVFSCLHKGMISHNGNQLQHLNRHWSCWIKWIMFALDDSISSLISKKGLCLTIIVIFFPICYSGKAWIFDRTDYFFHDWIDEAYVCMYININTDLYLYISLTWNLNHNFLKNIILTKNRMQSSRPWHNCKVSHPRVMANTCLSLVSWCVVQFQCNHFY